jgi:hypothetical protein
MLRVWPPTTISRHNAFSFTAPAIELDFSALSAAPQ